MDALPTLPELLRAGYENNPQRQLVMGPDEGVTYRDAWHDALAFARYLRETCGVKRGDAVLIAAPNTGAFPSLMAAVQLAGARLALLPAEVGRTAFERCVALVHPRVMVLSSAGVAALAREVTPEARVLRVGPAGEDGAQEAAGVAEAPTLSVENALRSVGTIDIAAPLPCEGADTELILFSSGSTGTPKAIVNRASSFARHGLALGGCLSLVPDDVLYVPVPFVHVFGIVGLYASLAAGATLVTASKYRPDGALSLIAGTRATVHLGVPTMFLRELRENEDDAWDLSSLRTGLVAGSSCPASVIEEFDRRYGCRLVQSYGMTETAATLTLLSPAAPLAVRVRGCGFPIPGAQVKLDPATGEILCKTPSLMVGVIGDDGVCRLDLDKDGWLHSGDVGAYDDEAGFSVVGRIKDLIIRGGINIFPVEVERLYDGHPAVSECCLVGYPDPELGERTCLCVRPSAGEAGRASAHELRLFAQGRIEKCRIPDVVLKLDDFPRLANGKIDKNKLRVRVAALLGVDAGRAGA